jgi:RNA polymerase sigma factor (sigma-70 family)
LKVLAPAGPGDGSTEMIKWITEIAQGNETALCSLYDATVHRVYGVALHITRLPAIAEEVVEEVFYQVWNTAATFDAARGNPLAWLLMISRSHAIVRLRSTDKALARADGDVCPEDCADNDCNPELLLMAFEERTLLHHALCALDGQDRQLIVLAFFRGLSHAEIARQMMQPLGTVKTRLRLALRRLHRKLDRIYP